MSKNKRILLDMSVTLMHHGHIRLIKKANKFGKVVIGLTRDAHIKKYKGFKPELAFKFRKEILLSIKNVKEVIPVDYYVTDNFLRKNKIDFLVHGNDNLNNINKKKLIIFKRTKNISSNLIRKRAFKNIDKIYKKINKKWALKK